MTGGREWREQEGPQKFDPKTLNGEWSNWLRKLAWEENMQNFHASCSQLGTFSVWSHYPSMTLIETLLSYLWRKGSFKFGEFYTELFSSLKQEIGDV